MRLMEIHFKNVNSDIVALVEVDALSSDRCQKDFIDFVNMMKKLGYSYKHFDKSSGLSGVAIFYKTDKFYCIESG